MNPELAKVIVDKGLKEIHSKSPYVFAIEGPVCAGKSSLINELSHTGIGTILEYSEYVAHARQDFPKFPPKDSFVAQKSFEFFLGLEKMRNQDLVGLSESRIAIDRSIYTLLAFEAGACAITGIDIFDWCISRLQVEYGLIMPNHIFYLDVSPATSRKRAEENGIPIPEFLLSDEFNVGFKDFFIRLSRMHPQYVSFISGERPLKETFESFGSIVSLTIK